MEQSIEKVLDRGERLDELELKADNLNVQAAQFMRHRKLVS